MCHPLFQLYISYYDSFTLQAYLCLEFKKKLELFMDTSISIVSAICNETLCVYLDHLSKVS